MSMAVNIPSREADLTRRATIAVSASLVILLMASSLEQFLSGAPAAWLPLVSAAVVLAVSTRVLRSAGRVPQWIRILPDGSVRLEPPPEEGGPPGGYAADVLFANRFAGLIYLRLAPTSAPSGVEQLSAPRPVGVAQGVLFRLSAQSAQFFRSDRNRQHCLLGRSALGPDVWAALSRWVVWRRRRAGANAAPAGG